ncbi:cytochrome P450 [Hyaloraphidium curvatum]|nr:cytochrome P450 [Hyaloraphidium curvatum]
MALTDLLLGAAALVAGFYVLKYLFYRLFLDFGDDIKTIPIIPLINYPEPKKIPIFHRAGLERMKEWGAVFRTVNVLKPWDRSFSIADPMLLKEIFVGKDWEMWQRGSYIGKPHFPYTEGTISDKNSKRWRDTRAMFDRTFTTVSVRKYTPILLNLRNTFLEVLAKQNADHPEGFDFFPRAHNLTFDVITRLTFGAEVKAQTTDVGREYSTRFDRWLSNASIMSLLILMLGEWSHFLIPKAVKEWKEDGDMMFGLLRGEAERAKRGEAPPSILADAYAIFNSEKMPETIDEKHLQAALMSILFAGHDTTAALLSFAVYELSRRPDLQRAIRAEVLEAAGEGELSNLEVLEKCKVLNACIKETLRRYPAAPHGGGRVMDEDFEFRYTDVYGQNRRIRFMKGDRVNPYIYGAQNYADFWGKNPDEWYPERFYTEANGDSKNLWAYAPFGNGARRCLGERLALGEARLVLASMIRKWDIEHVPGTPFSEIYAGTIKPNKVMIRLKEVKEM